MSELLAGVISTLTDSVEIAGRKIPIGILVVAGVVIGWFVLNKASPKSKAPSTPTASSIGGVSSPVSSASNDVSNIQASVAQQIQQVKTDTATSQTALKSELTGAFDARATTLQNAIDAARTSLQSGISQNSADLANLTKAGGTLSTLTTNVSNILGRLTATEGVAGQANTSITKSGGILDRLSGVETKANTSASTLTNLVNDVTKKGGLLDRLLSTETGLTSLGTRTGILETSLSGIPAQVSTNKARIDALSTLVSGTGGASSGLQGRISNLETYRAQNDAKLANLSTVYQNLAGEYSRQRTELFGDSGANKGILQTIRDSITALVNRLTGIDTLNTTQTETINGLVTSVTSLSQKLATYTSTPPVTTPPAIPGGTPINP